MSDLTTTEQGKLNDMCPAAKAVGLGTHLASSGIVAAAVAYFTATPAALVALINSTLTWLAANPTSRADLLYALRAYAGSNATQLEGLVGAAVTALADSGHLHNKGSDYTPAHPRIDISFAYGGTTYHWFLYTGS